YRLVWRLTEETPGEVLDQIPAPGTTVYQGAQIRLTVTRSLHWVKLFATSGGDDYESDVFTVPEHWRIRYRLTGNSFGLALAQFSWTGVDEFGSHGDRKSTRLNSSHLGISYAVFCLKKKKNEYELR